MKRLFILLNTYYVLALPFFLFILFIRILESAGYASLHPLPGSFYNNEFHGFLYDILLVAIVSGWMLIPVLLLGIKFPKTANTLQISLQTLLLFFSVTLSLYFIIAPEPLDHVIFTYSADDILFAAKSSSGSAFRGILVILAFLVIYLLLAKKAGKKIIPQPVLILLTLISLGCAIFPVSALYKKEKGELKNYLINNKLSYFYVNSYTYFHADEDVYTANPFAFLNENGGNWVFSDKNYPLQHKENTPDVLGPFFNTDRAKKPNIVFIIVESLSRSVIGTDAKLGNFAPFLDSLSKRSLYWPNFLSTAEHTFNVLPSSLGALPYSRYGFMHIPDSASFPDHYTSLRLLHDNGYYTRFYVGCWLHFDNMDGFMLAQNIDYIVTGWDPKYKLMEKDEKGFTWGYPDEALYQKSFEDIGMLKIPAPRFDVLLTVTSHAPFIVPRQEHYNELVKKQLQAMGLSQQQQDNYLKDQPQYASIMYTDDALRNYFKAYEKRADFKNTVFFIFGDHAMPELDKEKTVIERYNIPLIVYSPMLKGPQRFEAVSGHSNLTPTLLAFLKENYGIPSPQNVSWITGALDTAKEFRNLQVLPFMRSNRDMVDFLNRDYLLSNDQLYAVKPGLQLVPLNDDKKKNELKTQLRSFIALNKYVCENNKISPVDFFYKDFYSASLPSVEINPAGTDAIKMIDSLALNHKKELRLQVEFDYFTNDTVSGKQTHLIFSTNGPGMPHPISENISTYGKYGQKILPGKWNAAICEKKVDFSKISQLSNIFINSYFEGGNTSVRLKNIKIIIKANK